MSKIEFIDQTVTKHHPLRTWMIASILTSIFICGCMWAFFNLDLHEAIGFLLVYFVAWYFLIYPKSSESNVFVQGQDGSWVTLRKK